MRTWTQEELDAMRDADEELEEGFCMTRAEIAESRERDEVAENEHMDHRTLKRKEYNKAYHMRYYAAHKAEINAKCREYHAEHREGEIERSREWRERNAEYEQAYQKAYCAENREIRSVKARSNYEVNLAVKHLREWAESEGVEA